MTIKLAAIIAAALALLGIGFYFGGLRGNEKADAAQTALEGFQAAQSANTAKAVLAERASSAAELDRVNTKLKEFENAPPDPIIPGIVRRVFLYANAAGCPVSSSGAAPGGTLAASGIPGGDPTLERLSQEAADAAGRDAARLNLCRNVWPHPSLP